MAQKVVRNPAINLRALLFKGDMYWLAMGLERDIITQGKTIDEAMEAFIELIVCWIDGAQKENRRVFTHSVNVKTGETKRLPKSPYEYHISYGRAELYEVRITIITIGGETYKITVRFAIVRQKEDHPDNFKDQP